MLVTSLVSSQNMPQIEVLTTEQGLTFRDVRAIAQDTFGLMWFGTQQGLNRYDGYSFKVYNSNKNNPNFIEKDKITAQIKIVKSTNELWYVANEHIFKLNIETDKISAYTEKNGIKGDVLFLHTDEKENIWIVTDDYWKASKGNAKQYLQKFNGKDAFEIIAETKRGAREFTHITSDKENNLYWGTILKGILKFSENEKLLSEQIIDSFNWYGDEMYFGQSYFDNKNNQYYFVKGTGGVTKFNKATQSFEPFLEISEIVYHCIEDNQGNLWFATPNNLYRIDVQGRVQNFTKELKKRFDYSRINALYIDSNKLLWIGTDNGLFKIRVKEQLFGQLFKSNKEGWGNTTRSIFETKDGSIVTMFENQSKLMGIDTLGNQFELQYKNKNKKIDNLLGATRFFVLNEDKTDVFSVNNHLFKIGLDDGLVTLYKEFESRLNVTSANPLIALNNNNLLFGYSLSKLTIFDPETKESNFVFTNLKQEDNITHLRYFLESNEKNIVWVGTQNNGLIKINLNGTVEEHYNVNSYPNLSNNTVLVLFEEDNNLWIGTFGGGLDCLLLNENKITSFKKEQGLPDNNVVGILPYKDDYLWVSTYNGLSLFNIKTKDFQNFYVEDGLTHNEFNYTSFFIDSKGNYYFGGMNGVTKFDPKPILQKTELPPLLFTNYSRFSSKTNQTYNYDWVQNMVSEIEISPYDQYFTVDWTMPNYFQNSKNFYYTKLEGFEDRWFFQGNSASIRYNKLPAGDYVLHVRGTDSNGNLSSKELALPISVRQIFYKTWWFISLLILAIFALMSSVFHYRLQQLKAIDQLRTKISSDLHDDVGSLLSGLAMKTEMLEMNANQNDKPKLHKITKISREAISKMRDLVWSIDSRRERTIDLVERMEELLDEMLLPKEISFQINRGKINSNRKLPIEVKQHLFFIFKEAITNILRHSNATNVLVDLNNEGGFGNFIIKDNGTKSKNNTKTGLGLENMKMRAKKMNATITFNNDEGFSIEIKLPFSL